MPGKLRRNQPLKSPAPKKYHPPPPLVTDCFIRVFSVFTTTQYKTDTNITTRTIAKTHPKFSLFIAVGLSFLLAACGGGSATSTPTLGPITYDLIGTFRNANGDVVTGGFTKDDDTEYRSYIAAVATAAEDEVQTTATPRVTQASIADDNIQANAVNSNDSLLFSFINNISGGWAVFTGTARTELYSDSAGSGGYRTRANLYDLSAGRLFVKVATDLAADDSNASDYKTHGVWALVPTTIDSGNPIQVGAFVDSPGSMLTNDTYILTDAPTATYSGRVMGIYEENTDTTSVAGARIGDFTADVTLSATFGSSPVISGTIYNFTNAGDGSALAFAPSLTLGETALQNNGGSGTSIGGRWQGDTTASTAGLDYAGKWGGKFYGATAQDAVGTFGGAMAGTATSGEHSGNAVRSSFVGAFDTAKQE